MTAAARQRREAHLPAASTSRAPKTWRRGRADRWRGFRRPPHLRRPRRLPPLRRRGSDAGGTAGRSFSSALELARRLIPPSMTAAPRRRSIAASARRHLRARTRDLPASDMASGSAHRSPPPASAQSRATPRPTTASPEDQFRLELVDEDVPSSASEEARAEQVRLPGRYLVGGASAWCDLRRGAAAAASGRMSARPCPPLIACSARADLTRAQD